MTVIKKNEEFGTFIQLNETVLKELGMKEGTVVSVSIGDGAIKIRKTVETLTIKNDWETYRYYAAGKEIKPSEINYVYISDNLIPVTISNSIVSYEDHGHTYTANQARLKAEVMGIPVDLTEAIFKGIVNVKVMQYDTKGRPNQFYDYTSGNRPHAR